MQLGIFQLGAANAELLKMLIFLACHALILIFFPFHLKSLFFDFSQQAHLYCLDFVQSRAPTLSTASTLVCGQKLSYGRERQLLLAAQSIHLFVLSGAHLLFLNRIFQPLHYIWPRCAKVCVYMSSFILIVMSQMQAPLLRAFFNLSLSSCQRVSLFALSPMTRTLYSGMLCLSFDISFLDSLSLQLSWLASIALCTNQTKNFWLTSLRVILFCSPVLFQWQTPHLQGLLIGPLVSAFVGLVLFPLNFVSLALPVFSSITQSMYDYSLFLIEKVCPPAESGLPYSISTPTLWAYILALHIFYYLRELRCVRNSYS